MGTAVALEGRLQTPVPLSERLKRIASFESDMEELAKRKVPDRVDLDYRIDADAISKEATALVQKYGETMEFYQLQYTLMGAQHGAWTCLSMKAKNGDMCDDTTVYYPGLYNSTPAWHSAPLIRQLLQPIEPALRRVRLSIMHPRTMVAWHCDDCPRDQMGPAHCDGHRNARSLRRQWKNRFHRWVRLHLMLSTNEDMEFGIGGVKVHGTSNGNFYLANIAMPHRVDNKGSSSRTALLVDVRMEGQEQQLRQSELGRSILQATHAVKTANSGDTYLDMGRSLYTYLCGLTAEERYEAEWHKQAWAHTLWRPLPPFQLSHFNSAGRCGIFGPTENRHRLELLHSKGGKMAPSLVAQSLLALPSAGRRRRRRRS
jgi:hypothetical protein